jgi:hypothetical protein
MCRSQRECFGQKLQVLIISIFSYWHVWLFGWVNNKHEIEKIAFSMSLIAFYDMNGGQMNQMEKIIQK